MRFSLSAADEEALDLVAAPQRLTAVLSATSLRSDDRIVQEQPLAELWSTGRTSRIDGRLYRQILVRLDRLDVARRPEEINLPGFDFHALKGLDPVRYSVHVNGPWCITFEFDEGEARRVDFEQYH
jgi:proteic killer suppression protein